MSIQKASYGEALRQLNDIQTAGSENPYYWGLLGYAQAKLGKKADAAATRRRLKNFAALADVDIAGIYNGLEETTQALEWLENAYRDSGRSSAFIIDDPRFRNLHSNPRFVSVLKQMDLSY